MAIVEMKKLTLLALKRDREKLMRQLQKLGCVQIVEMRPWRRLPRRPTRAKRSLRRMSRAWTRPSSA